MVCHVFNREAIVSGFINMLMSEIDDCAKKRFFINFNRAHYNHAAVLTRTMSLRHATDSQRKVDDIFHEKFIFIPIKTGNTPPCG